MKAVVEHISGDRTSGYYYIALEGTNFTLSEAGHPEFPQQFEEGTEGKRAAEELAQFLNSYYLPHQG